MAEPGRDELPLIRVTETRKRKGLAQRARRTQRKRTENLLHRRDTEVTEELKSADYADFVLGSD
jgi:hypothetical protein